jgi:hypothetical protein
MYFFAPKFQNNPLPVAAPENAINVFNVIAGMKKQ